MKKIISIFVAVFMLFSIFAVNAFAGTWITDQNGTKADEYEGGSTGADVNIKITGSDVVHKYAVDITFPDLTFTYSTGSVWDTVNHQYVPADAESAEWTAAKEVTIENHSDLSVYYSVEASDPTTAYGDLSVELNGQAAPIASTELAKCEVGGEAPKATFTVGVSGTPTVSEIEAVLSKVTVTISKTNG